MATATSTSDATAGTSNSATDDADTDGFVAGVFEPYEEFAALCAAPRVGIDPATNQPYEDGPGTFVDENRWLRSWSNDLYLWFDEILDVNPADHDTPDYFALMKTFATTATGAPKDRFHFSMDSEAWRQRSQSGVSAGYGLRFAVLSASPPRRIVVAYLEAPDDEALAGSGLRRGAEILEADGIDVVNGSGDEAVASINAALFPGSAGERHEFLVRDVAGDEPRTITLQSGVITSDPVQNVHTIDTSSGPVGYLLFNDHIATAEAELVAAFETLRTAAIVDLVLDIRYNGGGFLDIANELAFMVAGSERALGRTFDELRFNTKHDIFNPVTGALIVPTLFRSRTVGFSAPAGRALPTVDLERLFVLTGPSTCSASESIINGLRGIDVEVLQIGSRTCGKPYGFYPFDNCGTTYFSIQFKNVNAKGFGDYTDGFSPSGLAAGSGSDAELPGCDVADDFTHELGDPQEARLATALAVRNGAACQEASRSRALRSSTDLSAAEGYVPKPFWLENRLLDWR